MSASVLVRAYWDGWAANVGAANLYYGQGATARLWRRGYRAMLVEMLKTSPAALRYEAVRRADCG